MSVLQLMPGTYNGLYCMPQNVVFEKNCIFEHCIFLET